MLTALDIYFGVISRKLNIITGECIDCYFYYSTRIGRAKVSMLKNCHPKSQWKNIIQIDMYTLLPISAFCYTNLKGQCAKIYTNLSNPRNIQSDRHSHYCYSVVRLLGHACYAQQCIDYCLIYGPSLLGLLVCKCVSRRQFKNSHFKWPYLNSGITYGAQIW